VPLGPHNGNSEPNASGLVPTNVSALSRFATVCGAIFARVLQGPTPVRERRRTLRYLVWNVLTELDTPSVTPVALVDSTA